MVLQILKRHELTKLLENSLVLSDHRVVVTPISEEGRCDQAVRGFWVNR